MNQNYEKKSSVGPRGPFGAPKNRVLFLRGLNRGGVPSRTGRPFWAQALPFTKRSGPRPFRPGDRGPKRASEIPRLVGECHFFFHGPLSQASYSCGARPCCHRLTPARPGSLGLCLQYDAGGLTGTWPRSPRIHGSGAGRCVCLGFGSGCGALSTGPRDRFAAPAGIAIGCDDGSIIFLGLLFCLLPFFGACGLM